MKFFNEKNGPKQLEVELNMDENGYIPFIPNHGYEIFKLQIQRQKYKGVL